MGDDLGGTRKWHGWDSIVANCVETYSCHYAIHTGKGWLDVEVQLRKPNNVDKVGVG